MISRSLSAAAVRGKLGTVSGHGAVRSRTGRGAYRIECQGGAIEFTSASPIPDAHFPFTFTPQLYAEGFLSFAIADATRSA